MHNEDINERNRKIIEAINQAADSRVSRESARAYLFKHGLAYDDTGNRLWKDPELEKEKDTNESQH